MPGFDDAYAEYVRNFEILKEEDGRIERQVKSIMAKWPESFGDHNKVKPPSIESEGDELKQSAWFDYKRLAVYHHQLGSLYNCLCDCLAWPTRTSTEQSRQKEALLDINNAISSLESQVELAVRNLAFIKRCGFPRDIFGAPD